MSTWNAPNGHSHGWGRSRRRRSSPSAPAFVRYTILALAAVLVITLAWRGVRWTMHPGHSRMGGMPVPYSPPSAADSAATRSALWQHDFTDALDDAARDAGQENVTAAEIAVDRGESMITVTRLQPGSASPNPDFFAAALAELDRVLQQRPDDQRLLEHVTQARISLAELRTAYAGPDIATYQEDASTIGRVPITAPREVSANETLGSKSFGGSFLDATLMPDTSEILLPPSSRAFSDNIRVENLTFEGASQTLDGIRWRNVIFVGTRLRYEGGELDLQGVQFVRCTFGFTADDRGARLANAIILDKKSFTIE